MLWFLRHRNSEACGVAELRQFFYYRAHGHEEAGGRFGNRQLTRPARPVTIKDYYIALRALFDWFVAQGVLDATPFASIPKPQVREEFKTALTMAQITSLLQAAQESTEPKRNVAILSLLLDTGCRASELISITLEDIDLKNRCCAVLGKSNKYRTVYFGDRTEETLKEYLEERDRLRPASILSPGASLFTSAKTREPLRISGLQQLIKRLKRKCGIRTSCSPHAFRRSFAVQSLKNGANVFSVQAMLGHTDLQMTQTYCALAQADIEAQHRKYSPMERFDFALAA